MGEFGCILPALVQNQLGMQAHCGEWFVFINKRRTQIKPLYYYQGRYCLWSKRLLKHKKKKFSDDIRAVGEHLIREKQEEYIFGCEARLDLEKMPMHEDNPKH